MIEQGFTERGAEQAFEYIWSHSANYAQSKSLRVQLEYHLKMKKAELMRTYKTGNPKATVSEAENHALCHNDYHDLVAGYIAAAQEEDLLNARIRAAHTYMDTYRTREASRRVNV